MEYETAVIGEIVDTITEGTISYLTITVDTKSNMAVDRERYNVSFKNTEDGYEWYKIECIDSDDVEPEVFDVIETAESFVEEHYGTVVSHQ